MEAVLVTRNPGNGTSEPSTADYRLEVNLGDSQRPPGPVTDVPTSEWPGSKSASYEQNQIPIDLSLKSHSLSGFSGYGSDQPNEFATFTMGRETLLSSRSLRENCEDDMRTFAERSDHTEGFMLSTPISDGFGGFSSVFLEMLRDEFTKSTIFTTAILSDSLSWKREDTERSINQRLMNAALSIHHLEEFSSMLLPIQPVAAWPENIPWARYLREDLPKPESYSQVLNMHLQSANNELREIDGLTSIVNQLNWRGDNKIAHLTGATPMLPPEQVEGEEGMQKLKDSFKDFSVQSVPPRKNPSARSLDPRLTNPFAQYTIMRGYEGDELERLGVVLEKSTLLKEPLSVWVCLPEPYPILPTLPPIFRSLIPSGRPLVLAFTPNADPFAPAGLFDVPPPLCPITSTYNVQPTSIPILTTLSTSPSARHLLQYLSRGLGELQRTRSRVLWEYEEGEYGVGREGLTECRERLESLGDALLGASGGLEEDEESDGMVGDEETGIDDGEESDGFGL